MYDPLEGWEAGELDPWLHCSHEISAEEAEANTVGITSTSPGVDRTTVRLLKAGWEYLGDKVRDLFNRCLSEAYYLRPWRLAEVAMIPKAGKRDLSSFRSWRPIALISCLGKGLERTMAKRMTWAAVKAGIVSLQQAGALPGRSATDLVASFLYDTEWALVMRRVVSILTMDVQGAFDALLRRRLLCRLRQQGWDINTLRLIDSFLTDRRV